jgi:hypothetical protein
VPFPSRRCPAGKCHRCSFPVDIIVLEELQKFLAFSAQGSAIAITDQQHMKVIKAAQAEPKKRHLSIWLPASRQRSEELGASPFEPLNHPFSINVLARPTTSKPSCRHALFDQVTTWHSKRLPQYPQPGSYLDTTRSKETRHVRVLLGRAP